MSRVQVKNFETEEKLLVHIDLLKDSKVHSFTLNRSKNELLEAAVDRLRISLAKKLLKKGPKNKKKSKKKETENQEYSAGAPSESEDKPADQVFTIDVLHNGLPVQQQSISNVNAWIEGAVLKIGEDEIPICCNLPSILKLKLPSTLMEGFPLYPCIDLEFCDVTDCEFRWKTFPPNYYGPINKSITQGKVDISDTDFVGCSFTPSSADIGNYIFLACLPKHGERTGRVEAVISSAVVSEGPGFLPHDKRHKFTESLTCDKMFRVVTYNLLAELYADSEYAREHLFVHCPEHALAMGYRKQLFLKEILGYHGDLLCLQEVDKAVFESYLKPALTLCGFTGLFKPKAGHIGEGCATFIRNSKFRIVRQMDITLSEYLMSDPNCADMWTEVGKCEQLRLQIEDRSTILQVTVLESTVSPGDYVCLANTHLYFHPRADNVRLIQGATALRYIQSVYQAYEQEGKRVATVFCGDFNTDPLAGCYQLFTSQWVPTDHYAWTSAGPEQTITSLELRHPMNITSATGTPQYTNYTPGFQECLDYVFIDADKLKVESVVPMPDHEDVIAHSGLPSPMFPSDHIALICDLKFR